LPWPPSLLKQGIPLTPNQIELLALTNPQRPFPVVAQKTVALTNHMLQITFALMWSASVAFTAEYAPEEWLTTAQSITSASYYCVGNGIGSILGGWAMQKYGMGTNSGGSCVNATTARGATSAGLVCIQLVLTSKPRTQPNAPPSHAGAIVMYRSAALAVACLFVLHGAMLLARNVVTGPKSCA
jgi:MFS family permease